MTAPHRVEVASFLQAFGGVLTDDLEHPETPVTGRLDEAAVDQRLDRADLSAADRLGRFDRELAGEHRQLRE